MVINEKKVSEPLRGICQPNVINISVSPDFKMVIYTQVHFFLYIWQTTTIVLQLEEPLSIA